jgi:pimeloyl-ACP methyl ester carboxylesterase
MEARRAHRGEPPFFTNNLGARSVFVPQQPPHAWVKLMKVAVSVSPDELYPAPKSWTERAYPKLIHFNKVGKGGHFAAWEQPKLFTEELRAAFKSLR